MPIPASDDQAIWGPSERAEQLPQHNLAPDQISEIDMDLIYVEDWWDPDRITYFRRKTAKCAEILAPH